MEKMVSQLDAEGFFVGTVVAYASPLETGVFHIPGGAVDVAPPDFMDPGKRYLLQNGDWLAHPLPAVSEYLASTPEEREEAENAQRDALLAYATLQIDPLEDALELGIATDEDRSRLTAWRMYRVEVARIVVTENPTTWPLMPGHS